MLRITICVGSSCSVRGSDDMAAVIEQLIERENLADQVELVGAFCMDQCSNGVSLKVGKRQYRDLQPQDAETFFYEKVLPCVQGKEK
jgi:NADH:ubiquinone oxidoreductase subunit E